MMKSAQEYLPFRETYVSASTRQDLKYEEDEILTELSISSILLYILLSLWSEDRDISNWINK